MQRPVEAYALEYPRQDALHHLGHDVGDQQDDQEGHQPWQELEERDEPLLDGVAHVHLG
jgi:hypothetical protein